MPPFLLASPAGAWRKLSRPDWLAVSLALFLVALKALEASGRTVPGLGLLKVVCYSILIGYSSFRLVSWIRRRKLWSIRNRLIVAYLFIAVVPLFLLGAMAGLSAWVIYRQLAAFLIYRDVLGKIERLAEISRAAAAIADRDAGEGQTAVRSIVSSAAKEFPGARWASEDASRALQASRTTTFAGLLQRGDELYLLAALQGTSGKGTQAVGISVPFGDDLLARIVPDLGPVQASITRPAGPNDDPSRVAELGETRLVTLRQLATRNRQLPPSRGIFDLSVSGLSKLDAVSLDNVGTSPARSVLFLSVVSRTSTLNQWLFALPGDVGSIFARGLVAVGVLFILLEAAALFAGIQMSRSITSAVDELYTATERVKEGDLSHRVRVARHDQLGALGDSFNAMTGSITDLIEEQRQRQRLENEISIAKEVQEQLFPRHFPQMPGVELYAACHAARMVSGDYYDFIPLAPNRVAIVIADISGKGISAALLMASLQAALRSQLLLEVSGDVNTADLVARLNRHLFLNTSEDRYATLFFAVYDTETHTLRYTNAGHLPPLLVGKPALRKLEEGGMVVGLFDEFSYEQGTIAVEPGSLLVAYSDGVTEPENAYGEQFGQKRLADEVLRHRNAPLQKLADQLFLAAEEWGGTPGQADDMTVLVARLS